MRVLFITTYDFVLVFCSTYAKVFAYLYKIPSVNQAVTCTVVR